VLLAEVYFHGEVFNEVEHLAGPLFLVAFVPEQNHSFVVGVRLLQFHGLSVVDKTVVDAHYKQNGAVDFAEVVFTFEFESIQIQVLLLLHVAFEFVGHLGWNAGVAEEPVRVRLHDFEEVDLRRVQHQPLDVVVLGSLHEGGGRPHAAAGQNEFVAELELFAGELDNQSKVFLLLLSLSNVGPTWESTAWKIETHNETLFPEKMHDCLEGLHPAASVRVRLEHTHGFQVRILRKQGFHALRVQLELLKLLYRILHFVSHWIR